MNLRIGIVLGSTREGRASEDVGRWVLDNAKTTEGVSFEIVDIKGFDLLCYIVIKLY